VDVPAPPRFVPLPTRSRPDSGRRAPAAHAIRTVFRLACRWRTSLRGGPARIARFRQRANACR
jgi:hypothetical protein